MFVFLLLSSYLTNLLESTTRTDPLIMIGAHNFIRSELVAG